MPIIIPDRIYGYKMNMIEKVARALCKQAGVDPDIKLGIGMPQLVSPINGSGFVIPPEELQFVAWTYFISAAHSAIEAMREPTKEMLNSNDPVAVVELVKIYQSMIDVALKE